MDQLRFVIDTIPTLVWSCRPDGAFDYVSWRWSDTRAYPHRTRWARVGWRRITPMTLANIKKNDLRQ